VIELLNYLAANSQLAIAVVLVGSLVVFGIVMLRQFKLVRANERYASCRCVNCGYDLRGSEERCPECGFPIQPPELPLTMPLSERLLESEWPKHNTHLRNPEPNEQKIEVYCGGVNEAKSLADLFRARGISASIRFSNVSSAVSRWPTKEIEYGTLCVWSGDLDQAIELIRHLSKTAHPSLETHAHKKSSAEHHAHKAKS
jgi:hypothetical protein